MLPRLELLAGSRHPEPLGELIDIAERALHTWQPQWSGFLEGAVREEAQERLGQLAELQLQTDGGYPGAERCRLLLGRRDAGLDPADCPAGLEGLSLQGNFLFDPAEPEDFRAALTGAGLQDADIGDVWLRGDRGAEAIVHLPEGGAAAAPADLLVRSVPVTCARLELEQLQPPPRRQPRLVHTVEASTRLDAVASAGFGLSRNRMGELIRDGAVRINWNVVTRPGQELAEGDRVQLRGRGELEVGGIAATKRERWRITLLRR